MNTTAEVNHRILIAEDVRLVSRVMATNLEKEGYEVCVAVDGAECLEKVQSFNPGLIILDLMLPKIHGIDVLKQLKSDPKTKNIGVAICTAKGFKTEIDIVTELGAVDVLIKPVKRQSLVAMVEGFYSQKPVKKIVAASTPASQSNRQQEVFQEALDVSGGYFRLWGTRGSIPISGPEFSRHGGNTSCMEIDDGENKVIFDAGSGIRNLGKTLLGGKPRKLHIFITHTHWDHIQGFPFFDPAYIPGFEVTIYGAEGFGKNLESVFKGQLDRDYFPVQLEDMCSSLNFKILGSEPIEIGDIKVSWEFTQHPGATVGYKAEIRGKKIVYAPDNEFLQGYLGSPYGIAYGDYVTNYQPFIKFAENADVLIHESQYTQEEYPKKIGWGHSSIANGCLLVNLSNAKKWIVIHHDPTHTDDFLQEKLSLTKQYLHRLECPAEVTHGFDGLVEYL